MLCCNASQGEHGQAAAGHRACSDILEVSHICIVPHMDPATCTTPMPLCSVHDRSATFDTCSSPRALTRRVLRQEERSTAHSSPRFAHCKAYMLQRVGSRCAASPRCSWLRRKPRWLLIDHILVKVLVNSALLKLAQNEDVAAVEEIHRSLLR